MRDVKKILQDLGYTNIIDSGDFYRMKPIYRDSSSKSSLSVNKRKGYFVDFGGDGQIKGSLEKLIKISLGLETMDQANSWLSDKEKGISNHHHHSISRVRNETVEIDHIKYWKPESFNKLIKDHSYWYSRGISQSTVEKFKGGVAQEGRMKDRYVFPIFDSQDRIVGVSGRYIYDIKEGSNIPKWKHIGSISHWVYPAFLSKKKLRKNPEIILVESIGNMLALWDCGIDNCLVAFGTNIKKGLLSMLLKLNAQKIIISFDNDENGAGQRGAEKTKKQLLNFFSNDKIDIRFPTSNDFGDMSKQEILSWKKKLKSYQHQD